MDVDLVWALGSKLVPREVDYAGALRRPHEDSGLGCTDVELLAMRREFERFHWMYMH